MNGIIIINKPQGFTSQDVVSKVKKILNIKKAGHIGTLDPLATGVFPVLLGEATKVSKYLMEHDKIYIEKVKLGEKRNTGDLEGDIVEISDTKISNKEKVKEVLQSFKGKQTQVPPLYSAIKVNGKKLYEYARSGQTVEIPERKIEIFKIELLNFDESNQEIEFKVECSKGTYIRTLCEDIASKLRNSGIYELLTKSKSSGILILKMQLL